MTYFASPSSAVSPTGLKVILYSKVISYFEGIGYASAMVSITASALQSSASHGSTCRPLHKLMMDTHSGTKRPKRR